MCGYSGSGKTTASLYLSRKYGYHYVEESDALRSVAEDEGIEKPVLSKFCDQKISENGPLFFIKFLINMHRNALENNLVISGVRNVQEVEYLKSRFKHTKLIFLDTTIELRTARCSFPGNTFNRSKEELIKLQEIENNWGMKDIQKGADVVINNNGNINSLFRRLDSIVNRI